MPSTSRPESQDGRSRDLLRVSRKIMFLDLAVWAESGSGCIKRQQGEVLSDRSSWGAILHLTLDKREAQGMRAAMSYPLYLAPLPRLLRAIPWLISLYLR
jgi:hypothetical protein